MLLLNASGNVLLAKHASLDVLYAIRRGGVASSIRTIQAAHYHQNRYSSDRVPGYKGRSGDKKGLKFNARNDDDDMDDDIFDEDDDEISAKKPTSSSKFKSSSPKAQYDDSKTGFRKGGRAKYSRDQDMEEDEDDDLDMEDTRGGYKEKKAFNKFDRGNSRNRFNDEDGGYETGKSGYEKKRYDNSESYQNSVKFNRDGGYQKNNRFNQDGGYQRKNYNEDGGYQRKNYNDEGGYQRKNYNDDGGYQRKNYNDEGGYQRNKFNNDGGYQRNKFNNEEGGYQRNKFNNDGGYQRNKFNNDEGGLERNKYNNDREFKRNGYSGEQKVRKFIDSRNKDEMDSEEVSETPRYQKGRDIGKASNYNIHKEAQAIETIEDDEDIEDIDDGLDVDAYAEDDKSVKLKKNYEEAEKLHHKKNLGLPAANKPDQYSETLNEMETKFKGRKSRLKATAKVDVLDEIEKESEELAETQKKESLNKRDKTEDDDEEGVDRHESRRERKEGSFKKHDNSNEDRPGRDGQRRPFRKVYRNENLDYIIGQESVYQTLKAEKREKYHKLYVLESRMNELTCDSLTTSKSRFKEISKLCTDLSIDIEYVNLHGLNNLSLGGPHQGVVLEASFYHFPTISSVSCKDGALKVAVKKGEPKELKCLSKYPLALGLDSVMNPHNMGSILRSTHFFGLDLAFMMNKTPNPTNFSVRASAGALETSDRFFKVKNSPTFIKDLKKEGWLIVGTELNAKKEKRVSLFEFTDSEEFKSRPTLVILGNEGMGLSEELIELCDKHVIIPGALESGDALDSLNVSTSAGIIISQLRRNHLRMLDTYEESKTEEATESEIDPVNVEATSGEAADKTIKTDETVEEEITSEVASEEAAIESAEEASIEEVSEEVAIESEETVETEEEITSEDSSSDAVEEDEVKVKIAN